MNDILQKIVLGSEAKTYILKRLSDGNTLTKLLFKCLQGAGGDVKVAFPKGVTPINLDKFRDGGKLPADTSHPSFKQFWGRNGRMTPIPFFRDFLIDTIESFLREDSENICVFEDTNPKPTDLSIRDFGDNVLFYGDEVYHFIRGCDVTRDDIESGIKMISSWQPEAGILTSLDDWNPDFLKGGSVSLENLKQLATNIKAVFVEAYDHENFLIWDFRQ